MKLMAIGLIIAGILLGDTTTAQVKGPRGGCYTIRKNKSGKEYKRYAPCRKDAK